MNAPANAPAPAAPKPPPPKPPPKVGSGNSAKPQTESRPATAFGISHGTQKRAAKVVLYGSGGIGKSELCSLIKQVGIEPLFIDIEDGSHHLDATRLDPAPSNWDELRAVLHGDLPSQYGAIVIDSLTRAEEMAAEWTIKNIPHEKKDKVIRSIEDYGFGKGYTHVYETFLNLLGDLDSWARRGKHILCTAHDCTATVPNPVSEDWIRYEPRLQSPPSGKGSIRLRVKEWTDHLLFIGYDVAVTEGKGTGAGTRAIYPVELPTHMAKSRSISDTIVYPKGSFELWKQLLSTGANA